MNFRPALASALAVVVALAAIFAWLLWPARDDDAPPRPLHLRQRTVASPKTQPAPAAEVSTLAQRLNAPAGTIQADLRIVEDVIDAYRSNFHENPVGTNAEITAALMGRNRLLLSLIPQNHPAVNFHGELCDRWGHAFFFHQLSGTRMEVRSAGPDGTLWTEDDAVLTPGE
ncbi:MAG: hypothetical protein JSR48_06765 [Verrucomicrobia bacterium]|nr:hypothetical protein [Verrucomicrobiota bacterium]